MLRARLSVMMFLEYWPLGLWGVTVQTYIAVNTGEDALFSAGFLGLSASASAVGSLVAPTVFGWVADRHFAAEKLLAMLHLGAAAALWGMIRAESQWPFFIGMAAYFQCFSPSATLTSTVALRTLRDPHHEFPAVRLYGTVAWIAAGVFVGAVCPWWWGDSIEPTRWPMVLGAVSHLVMAAYSLTLPDSSPAAEAQGAAAAQGATAAQGAMSGDRAPGGGRVGILRNAPLALFLTVSLLASIPSQPYNFANAFLNQQGYPGAAAMLTLGQITEVACMAMTPFLARRYRLKTLFLIGVLGWAMRYTMLALGSQGGAASPGSLLLVLGAIVLHGPSYVFVYIAGQMYVDRLVDRKNRGAAQGLHAVATAGVGHLTGAFLTAWSQATFLTPVGVSPPPYHWTPFWLAPVALGLVAAGLFAALFSDRPRHPHGDGAP